MSAIGKAGVYKETDIENEDWIGFMSNLNSLVAAELSWGGEW